MAYLNPRMVANAGMRRVLPANQKDGRSYLLSDRPEVRILSGTPENPGIPLDNRQRF